MSYVDVLREIESRGLRVSIAGEDLRLQGPRDLMDPGLIQKIKSHKQELVAHLSTAAQPVGFPLLPLQTAYLIGRTDAFEFGNVANHIYREIAGVWDLDRLQAALHQVVQRHAMLRTAFTEAGRQFEQEGAEIHIGSVDLRGLSAQDQQTRCLELREQRSHRIMPADHAPLVAVNVTILADDRMVMHISHDGLVMDGISEFLLGRDWWAAYHEGRQLVPLAAEASFEACVAALEANRTKAPAARSRAYWLGRLDDLAPPPDLPLRVSPATITAPRFSPRAARLDAQAWAGLKARAAQAGLTPSAALLAAYAEALSAWGGGSRFTLNTTFAHRPPIHPDIYHAVGPFTDTLLIELEVDRAVSFTERAQATQAQLRRDLDHRHFSGIEVLRELGRRRGGSAARMPYTFSSAIGYVLEDIDGRTFDGFGEEIYVVSQTPQVWLNAFAREVRDGVVVEIDGVDELFPEGLLDAFVAGYQSLLDGLLTDDGWSTTTDLLPPEQRARRRVANDTARPVPGGLLQEAFSAQVARAPNAAAVITARETLTYAEVSERAHHAAAWLRQHEVARDELVGLVMHRGPHQSIGVLATLLAGGAYLPIDAGLPHQRQQQLLRDGKVRCVLTNTGWQDSETAVLDLTGFVPSDEVSEVPTVSGADPDDLAYVLYTSGTTGMPKGVMVSHRSVANVVADCNERFGINPRDRFFAISAFNFDLSVYDIFGALTAGAAIVVPDRDDAADSAQWLQLCESTGVTVWNSVPAIVSMLHSEAVTAAASGGSAAALAALRLVMMSGDRIPPALPAALRQLKADLTVVSLGGPTETTIWNILHPIAATEDGSRPIAYGRPNANNRAYVLDATGQDAPDWVPGEIYAAGMGLARGYWGDPQRTAEKFHFDQRRRERLYRTGDLARYLPDGDIDILGRADHQIKVNGYRIEAGEVEQHLRAITGVAEAIAVKQENAQGTRLVAHLTPSGPARPHEADLRRALGSVLPDYMVPSAFVWHDHFPLTRNGKVDRGKLSEWSPISLAPKQQSPADRIGLSETERVVIELWSAVLGVTGFGPTDNFFDLGGSSIAAARIVSGVRKRYRIVIPLHRLQEVLTVRAMAAHIDAAVTDR